MARDFADKSAARQWVWDRLSAEGVARFPFPPHGRIRCSRVRLLSESPFAKTHHDAVTEIGQTSSFLAVEANVREARRKRPYAQAGSNRRVYSNPTSAPNDKSAKGIGPRPEQSFSAMAL